MRGLVVGIALTLVLLLVPGGHFLFVLLVPLASFALIRYRTTWLAATKDVPREQDDSVPLGPSPGPVLRNEP
jgi:hypothetical protein